MNIKLMKHLCKLSQDALRKTLYDYLIKKYDTVIHTKDYIIAEGDIPICLVAHLDTVFKIPPDEIYYDEENKVMWSPQGLGADDRAGIYAILNIIKAGYKPHIVLTTDEELGGVGALHLIKEYPECPFTDLKAIIELDRQGEKDCVFYDCANLDFETYIQSFGFVTAIGSFSDISFIAPAWGVAAVNLSVGYVDEHTYCERLFFEHLHSTIEKVKEILSNATSMLNYAYIPLKYSFAFDCAICQKHLWDHDFHKVDVYGTKFDICDECYELYYKPHNHKHNHRKTRKRK